MDGSESAVLLCSINYLWTEGVGSNKRILSQSASISLFLMFRRNTPMKPL